MNDFCGKFWTEKGPDLDKLINEPPQADDESRALAIYINERIREAWDKKRFHITKVTSPDVAVFQPLQPIDYEFMKAKVSPGAVEDGIGVLEIIFPAGCTEADIPHTHPGGRVVMISAGTGFFHFFDRGEERTITLKTGDMILMPPLTVHNFSASYEQDMVVISAHVGYKDVEGEDAIKWVVTT